MDDLLAEAMVDEYEEKGKKISFELARSVVKAETNDSIVKLMMHTPEFSAEKVAAFLDVSLRFVQLSVARYGGAKKGEPNGGVTVWEQILEMKKRDDPKSDWSKDCQERWEKDFSIRISEQIEVVEADQPAAKSCSGLVPSPPAPGSVRVTSRWPSELRDTPCSRPPIVCVLAV